MKATVQCLYQIILYFAFLLLPFGSIFDDISGRSIINVIVLLNIHIKREPSTTDKFRKRVNVDMKNGFDICTLYFIYPSSICDLSFMFFCLPFVVTISTDLIVLILARSFVRVFVSMNIDFIP